MTKFATFAVYDKRGLLVKYEKYGCFVTLIEDNIK